MKKLRAPIEWYFDKLDDRWRAMPLSKQRQYTLYFFVGYLLLTAVVIGKVMYDKGSPETICTSSISKTLSLKVKRLQNCRTVYQQF